jgi:hypothetical protein
MAAIAGAGALLPPLPSGSIDPPAVPNAPDIPDDTNPTCRNCGRPKHMLDLMSSGRYKKICKSCHNKGVKTTSKTMTSSQASYYYSNICKTDHVLTLSRDVSLRRQL